MSELVPLPCVAPEKIYKYRRTQPLSGAEVVTYMTREVKEVEGEGIFTYYHGIDIPRVGVSPTYQDFPKAMAEVDKVKRSIREYLKNLFLYLRPEKTLRLFNEFADRCLGQWYLGEEYVCPTAVQVWLFLDGFLEEMGIDVDVAIKTAEIVATIIEYDDAYRYRLNDLMSETTKEKILENPAREIKRLLKLGSERENYAQPPIMRHINKLLSWVLLIPKVKRAILQGFQVVNWRGWQLTESEIFHTLVWKDYNVMGRSWDDRQAYYEMLFQGKRKPQQICIRLK